MTVAKHDSRLRGKWIIRHMRGGKEIGRYEVPNGIADVGANYLLDAGFHGDAQISAWYIGLIDNAGFTALAAGDTAGSHAGWSECSSYDEATRVQWTCDSAASRAISNPSTNDVTINATKTLKGVFISSVATKGSGTGTLWATAAFASPMLVNVGDILKFTYTVTSGA